MGWLVDLIARLFGLWLNRKPAAVAEGEKLGAAQAQLQEAQTDAADVQKAVQAANASRAATLGSGSLREPTDPDCRDCDVR